MAKTITAAALVSSAANTAGSTTRGRLDVSAADGGQIRFRMTNGGTGPTVQCEALREALDAAGIETRPVFYPIHTMPMYAQRFQSHPVAEDIARRGINLPSWPGLSDGDVDRICGAIRTFMARRS